MGSAAHLQHRMVRRTLPLVVALTSLGCAKARPVANDNPGCPTWQAGDLSNGTAPRSGTALRRQLPELPLRPSPAANYDLSSYLSALGVATAPLDPDANNAAAVYSASAQLVAILQPETTDATHAGFSALAPIVAKWVNECGVPFFNSGVHSSGILNPADPGFHGSCFRRTTGTSVSAPTATGLTSAAAPPMFRARRVTRRRREGLPHAIPAMGSLRRRNPTSPTSTAVCSASTLPASSVTSCLHRTQTRACSLMSTGV